MTFCRRSTRTLPAALLLTAVMIFALCGCGTGTKQAAGSASSSPKVNMAAAIKQAASGAFTLAAAGDVNFGDGVAPYISSGGVDYPWSSASAVFAQGDLSFVNLECCLSTQGSPVAAKEFTFEGSPEAAAGMKTAGIDVVSLANNHSKDYGTQAFLDTMTNLKAQGIAWCGAGNNAAEAYSPAVLNAHGVKVAFLAFTNIVPDGWPAGTTTPGCAVGSSADKVARTVADAKTKSKADFVIVSFHWGIELATSPGGEQRSLAHAAVDAGADVVLGHHPHVVQGFEVYKNRLIAYSLGNFVFAPPREISAKTVSVLVSMNKDGLRQAKVVPMVISSCRPVIMTGSSAGAWLATVQGYSSQLGTSLAVRGERGFIEGQAVPGSARK